MDIIDISRRQITLSLSPEDAQRLARACRAAERITGGDCGVTSRSVFGVDYSREAATLYEALAAAFEGAGMGCVAYSYIIGGGPDKPEFSLENLRAQKIGDRLW